jgi:prolyl-tRNA synthetase
MRWSTFFCPTLKEDPKDADAVSHKLMVRAGLIRRLGAGAYSYLPMGVRVLHRAIAIVREEMDRAGAQELLLPAMQPVELWKRTGRYDLLGDVLIRFKDRTGKEVALGPTHEEVVTDLLREVQSHRQLPVTIYQIQTKFRDEPRPRFGVIRSKEFLMKDAYSFDVDPAGLDRSYQTMYDAYRRIFARAGLNVLACEADPGVMGGNTSHEFMVPSPNGEDTVVRCLACGYAANLEAAAAKDGATAPGSTPQPLKEVATPGKHTVEQVSGFLKVTPQQLLKTLIYESGKEAVAVLVRGDHEVNEAKLRRLLKDPRVALAGSATIERLTKAPVGFTGPVKLGGVKILADHAAMKVVNAVAGANKAEAHLVNVNPGRDFQAAETADLRVITPQDACPTCGGAVEFVRAIEVGHVFKLGTKYTEALGVSVQDPAGRTAPIIMGCYGIGINRIVAAAVEQHHDAQGIVWPVALAPFDVVVTVMEADSPDHARAGEQAAEALRQAGREVLLDDRPHSPGSKLKDADLVGIPVQVVVGKAWQAGELELTRRSPKERTRVKPTALVEAVDKLLDRGSSP